LETVPSSFWRKKRVLVTGHTGFKGSWLTLWLQSMGASVTGYALAPPTTPNLFELTKADTGISSVPGDVRDLAALQNCFNDAQPEIVIHMAAQALVRQSYADPVGTYQTNAMGTVHVLESVRNTPSIRAVVVVTSDKCYDNREWIWGYRETEPMGGFEPYSNSKGCAELIVSAYRNSFFHPTKFGEHGCAIASARAGNVFGGGDWAEDRLVPDIFRAVLANQNVVLRNPDAVRPWQHVLEPLSGYLLLAQGLVEHGSKFAEGWNFGPSEADVKSVRWVTETILQQWGHGVSWKLDEGANPHEAHLLKLDSAKARGLLHWCPKTNLETGLKMTVDWYKAYASNADLRRLTLQQIANYVALPKGTVAAGVQSGQ
jgi:CDP-glucose 4,6-dehydratase